MTVPGGTPTESPTADLLFCTICSKRKRRAPGTLPAIRRYLSRRIRFVHALSQRRSRPMRILSGQFGLLRPDDAIPWYDRPLTAADVDILAPIVAEQLAATGARRVAFFARPRLSPGWNPYYQLLERACRERGIPLEVERLPPRFP